MKSRQTLERQELAMAMATGAALGRITPARLMSPTELEAAVRGRPDLAGRLQGWCLCVEVPAGMWQRARDACVDGVPNQIFVAETLSGRRYFVVVIHAAGWQHRVCIPLLGELTSQWLDSLSSKRVMTMSMANAESDRAFVSDSRVPAEALAHLSGLDTSIPDDLPGFIEEAFGLVMWNATAANSTTVEHLSVPDEVSLSLLLPAEVEAHLEQRSQGWAKRKPS